MISKISIILVNYNGSNDTLECINSLKKCNYPNYEVVVVDNSSKDNDRDNLVKNMPNDIKIIFSNINTGFSGGNNLGINYAINNGAEYICLLNNDTVVEFDFLSNLYSIITKHSNIGIVSPMIKNYYNHSEITYGGGFVNHIKGGVFIYGINSDDHEIMQQCRKITFASGCCMLFRKEVFLNIGGLPEDYFLYFEDTDFSEKAINLGFEIWYAPSAVIYHKESVSTNKNSPNYQYYFVRNRLFFIRDNFNIINKFSAYPITLLYAIKKIITKQFQFRNVLDGCVDFLKGKNGKRDNNFIY